MVGFIATLVAIYCYWEPSKRYLSFLSVFFLVTGGFQIIPENYMVLPILGISKTYDWALVYAMALIIITPHVYITKEYWERNREVVVFTFVLFFLSLYSIYYVGVEQQVTIRVLRNYLFFVLLFPFLQLPKSDYTKVMRLLVYLTTVASILYCLQPILGRTLLNGAPVEESVETVGLLRFYNLPYYVVPVIFLLFIHKPFLNIRFHNIMLGLNILVIILSQHRNLLLTLVCCYFIYLLISNRFKLKSLVVYGLILFSVSFAIDGYFNNRFSEGLLELLEPSREVTPYYLYSINSADISTTEFRRLHFLERLHYALESTDTSLFGLGFLTEDSWLVNQFSFNIGLASEYGELAQVSTSDISWSIFVVHFGILGTLGLLYFYLGFAAKFYLMRKYDYCKVGLLYIIALLMTSFYGVDIILPHTISFIVFIVSYWYCCKYGIENVKSNSSQKIKFNYNLK